MKFPGGTLFGRIFLLVMMIYGTRAIAQDDSTLHAQLTYHSDGTVDVRAKGAWPINQVINRVRREFGWVVDYEGAPMAEDKLETLPGGHVNPITRSLRVTLRRPRTSAPQEELDALESIVGGLRSIGERYRVVPEGDAGRFDIVADNHGRMPLFSTPISIRCERRSVEEAVGQILTAVTSATGESIVQAGIASSARFHSFTSVCGSGPARVLLANVLESMEYRQTWTLGYASDGERYVINLEPAVQEVPTTAGQILVKPIRTVKLSQP